jgi:O-antigen/teichoic acid export membrane protein
MGWRGFGQKGSGVLATLLGSTYWTLPLVFVSALAPEATPVYALADRLLRLALTALSPLSQVAQGWVPAGPPGELGRRIRRALSAIALAGAAAGSGLAILGPWVGLLLSGFAVRLPWSVTVPLGLALGACLVTTTVGLACLVPLGRQAFLLYSAVAGAVVNLVMQFALVPRFGATGAACAVAAAEGGVLLVQLTALLRRRRGW